MSEDLNKSTQFADETIRRFLLCDLDAAERSNFEEQFLVDDELAARVRLVEFDLTDKYAFSRLSAADQKLFEQTFLLTTERKRKLNVSSALRDRFAPESVLGLPMAERVRFRFEFRQTAWRYAFALLLLTLLVATVWLVAKEPQIVKRLIPKRVLPKPVATSSPQEASHPNAPSTPTHAEQSQPLPSHEAIASVVVLNQNTSMTEAPSIKRPPSDNEVVRLQLTIEKNQTGAYRAEVLIIAGGSIYAVDSLTSYDGLVVNVDIPARLIKPGDYQVRLSRSTNGSPEQVASYYFRVQ